ncbi:hypothetical protein BH23PLA1_BH23PLA1_17240 [soil metagenome]
MFIYIKCTCGRSLKAQRSPNEHTISCWDCGAKVKVPRYRESRPKPVRKESWIRSVEWTDALAAAALLALITLVVIMIPIVGPYLTMALFTVGGMLYTMRIEEVGIAEADESEEPNVSRRRRAQRSISRFVIGSLLAVGLSLPFWIVPGVPTGFSRPTVERPYLLLSLFPLIWLLLPMLVFVLMARSPAGRLGVRGSLLAVRRQPRMTLLAILLPATTLLALEALLLGVIYLAGWMLVFVLDLFPNHVQGDLNQYEIVSKPAERLEFSLSAYLEMYTDAFSSGFTMVSSIPLSLSRGFSAQTQVSIFSDLTNENYLLIRLGFGLVVLVAILVVLMVQATLLGWVARSVGDLESASASVSPSEHKD